DVGLVREALRERGLLLRNAPHLVHERDFVVPARRWWDRPYYGAGLWVYDRLAGSLRFGHSRIVGKAEALRLIPTLNTDRLRGGVVYRDGQFDDAGLAVALARTADDLGATVLNYVEAVGLAKGPAGHTDGVVVRDVETGEAIQVGARAVVNATGVFAEEVVRFDEPAAGPLLTPSQGAHIVLDRSFLPGDAALMVPKTDDGRVLFAIPWLGRVIVGTTDTPVGATTVEPRPLAEERAFLLEHAGRYLSRAPKLDDIRSEFAGLRPLLRPARRAGATATSKVSREHATLVARSGLVTITGGKWTTYRRMAVDAIDAAAQSGDLPARPSATAALKLHGWVETPSGTPFARLGADEPAFRSMLAEAPAL
ncbi:MAG: FAD-dependent oxidoreductase, partial [Thermoleophilia bacterium]|nr:FAD-dependent oxidoreductase [Thermoleophilia bacterium]